jgi:hypothetical protein
MTITCHFLILFLSELCYNTDMKTKSKAVSKSLKPFSIKDLNKTQIKSRSFETMRTSFAIEGIRFSKSQLESLKSRRHIKK